MKRIVLALGIVMGIMTACNETKEVQQAPPAPPTPEKPQTPKTEEVAPVSTDIKTTPKMQTQAADWVFTMERTPCFGKCPWDSFTVRADGSIYYEGKRDVERIGAFTGVVDADRAAALKAELNELGYFDWKTEYDNNISDLPSLKLRFMAKDGFTKVVSIRGEAPTGTESIRNLMLGLYESIQDWQEAEVPEVPHNE